MVGHLEQVPGLARVADGCQQLTVAVCFEVTHQQHALRSHADAEDERGVVDLSVRSRGRGCHIVPRWPQHVHPCRSQPEGIALAQPQAVDAEAIGSQAQLSGPGSATGHPGLSDAPDAIARHEARQAPGMILVGVGQHDEVDAPVPDGDALVEPPHQQVRIGPAVHEQA